MGLKYVAVHITNLLDQVLTHVIRDNYTISFVSGKEGSFIMTEDNMHIADIDGNLDDLIGQPITVAREIEIDDKKFCKIGTSMALITITWSK